MLTVRESSWLVLVAAKSMAVYKNPPVQEAVCEFHFAPLKGDPEWDLTLPGKLQLDPRLAEYSGPSRQQTMQSIVAGGPKGEPAFNLQSSLFRIHLPTQDDRALLSLGHNTLGVVVLRPYEGWENFRPRIMNALEVFCSKSGLTIVNRIGVRYINRIVTPVPDASTASKFMTGLRTHIEAVEADGKTKRTSRLTALNSRQEFVTSDNIKVLVTHATLDPQTTGTAEYLLDIDIAWDRQPLTGENEMVPMVDKLHEIEGAVFESLITEEARKLFNAS
jgi:uncharacterized protein (TIGR04255 family)